MRDRTRLLLNSLSKDNIHDFCNEYAFEQCVHKKKIRFRSAVTGEVRELYVPCGKCRVCKSYRVKEWVSRMAIHTQYCRKYVYFITLTYKPFILYKNIPTCLLDAYWREDDLNKTHHRCFSPCLLRHEHFQRYMHYLRKSLKPATVDFFMCGEYGEHFGRPHFHALIWSDVPIAANTFRMAWRVNISKSTKYPKMVTIGDCRVDDLQENGTLASNSASKAFRYVAKYCVKSQYLSKDDSGRLQLFLDDCKKGLINDEQFNFVFNSRVRSLKPMLLAYANYIAPILRNHEIVDFKAFCNSGVDFGKLYKILDVISPYNKKNECSDTSYLFTNLKTLFDDETISFILRNFYCTSLGAITLRKVFHPYCLSSNRSPLGKQYAIKHLEEYKRDECRLPETCGFTPIFPRYFSRLVQRSIRRYDCILPSVCSRGYSCRVSANEIDCEKYINNLASASPDVSMPYSVYIPYGCAKSASTPTQFIKGRKGVIRDYNNDTYIVPTLLPDGLQFDSYKFNRYTREYDLLPQLTMSLPEFLDSLLDGVSSIRFADLKQLHNLKQYNALIDDIRKALSIVDSDFMHYLSDAELYHDYNLQKLRDLSMNINPHKPLLE